MELVARLAAQMTAKQVERGRIPVEKAPVYRYGYEIVINYTINFVMAAAIAVIFRAFLAVGVFLFSYLPLRSYAGGYHASTHERCTVVSGAILIVYCLAVNRFPLEYAPVCVPIFILLEAAVILTVTPVEDKNKPLTPGEIRVFGRRCKAVWAAELAAIVLLVLARLWQVALMVSLSQLCLAIMLIGGLVKNRRLAARSAPEGAGAQNEGDE